MNYSLDKIYDDGRIDVTFDVDGLTQNLSGAPLDDLDALNQFLFDYGTSYTNSINSIQPPVISADVQALVGQSVSLEKVMDKGVETLKSTVSSIKPTPEEGVIK